MKRIFLDKKAWNEATKTAKNIYLIATFTLFTEGVDKFVEAFDKGLFNKLYTTNLSYIPENVKELDWFNDVDCSKYLALIINTFNKKDDYENRNFWW